MAVERQVRRETSVPPILGKEKILFGSQFHEGWGLAIFFGDMLSRIPPAIQNWGDGDCPAIVGPPLQEYSELRDRFDDGL